MEFEIHDYIGSAGALVLLTTYLLLQVNRIQATSLLYSQLNALGSGSILVSLAVDFNLSAFVIEVAWLAISLLGIVVTLRDRRAKCQSVEES